MLANIKFAHKINLVAAVLLIFALTISTASHYISIKAQTHHNLEQGIAEIATSVSGNIANWLNSKLAIVNAVSIKTTGSQSRDEIMETVQLADAAGDFKNVYVSLESNGLFILDDPSIVLPDDFDARQRPWYTQAKTERHPSFTEPYVDVTINKPLISAISPVIKSGELVGVAGGDILLDEIANIINEIKFLELGYAYLMTDKGKILSHPNAKFIDKNVSELLGFTPKFSRELIDIDDKNQIVSFLPVQGIESVKWYVGVVLDQDKAYEPLNEAKNNALIFGFISVVLTVILLHFLVVHLMKPISELNAAIQDISEGDGDLTQRLTVNSGDEIGELSKHFNVFLDKIHHSMSQVHEVASALNNHISQVRNSASSGIAMAEQQLSRGTNVSTAVTELSSSAQEISTNATTASGLTSDMQTQSQEGVDALSNNIGSMQKLSNTMSESSVELEKLSTETQNIGNILDVIKGVSSQTNLLALNAAIEAARAGEAGRGFAVVADEVRQLAQRTQDATQEIEVMIENLQTGSVAVVSTMGESQKNSTISVELANTAGNKMQQIIDTLGDVDRENHAVAEATIQQVNVIQSIDEDILHLMQLNEQGVNNLEQTQTACDDLQKAFDDLSHLVGQFKVS